MKQRQMFFQNSLAFSIIQQMLEIWSLVTLSFLNPACTSWNFLVRIMLKPSMQDFKHDLTSIRDECNCSMVSRFFGSSILGNWDEDLSFPVLWHCWIFQISWHNEWKPLRASLFRILNSSARISLHPLALLTAVLLKPHLTSQSIMSGSGGLITPL